MREEGGLTRTAIQPIVDLITVKDTESKREVIVARQAQIAVLQAANRKDRQELQREAAEAKRKAKAKPEIEDKKDKKDKNTFKAKAKAYAKDAAAGKEEVVEMDRDEPAQQAGDEESKDHEQKNAEENTPQQIVDTYIDNKAKRDVEAIIAEVEEQQRIDADVTGITNKIDARQKIRNLVQQQ